MSTFALALLLSIASGNQAFSQVLALNQDVISSNGVPGIVVGKFLDSSVAVKFITEAYPRKQLSDSLAIRTGAICGLTINDEVFSPNGVAGTVAGIYVNGRVAVKYISETYYLAQECSQLAKRQKNER